MRAWSAEQRRPWCVCFNWSYLWERSHWTYSHFSSARCDKQCQTLANSCSQIHTHARAHTFLFHCGCYELSNNIRFQSGVSGIIRITHPLYSSLCLSSSLTVCNASTLPHQCPPPTLYTHPFLPCYASDIKSWSPLVMASSIYVIVWNPRHVFFSLIRSLAWRRRRRRRNAAQSWGSASLFEQKGVGEMITVGDE